MFIVATEPQPASPWRYSSRHVCERLRRQAFGVYRLREVGLKRRSYVSYRFDNDRDFITAIAAKDSKLQKEKRKKEQKALITFF